MTGTAAESGGWLPEKERKFLRGVARAAGGAIFFSLPLLMTMEMWWLGFTMSRGHLALLTATVVPVLIGLSRFAGFESTHTWKQDVMDGAVAYGIGFGASAMVLLLFNLINTSLGFREVIGKIALQAVPSSFGAVLASSQLKQQDDGQQEQRKSGYGGELFLMLAGAIFFAFNVAPTEEMIVIAYKMSAWQGLALVGVSLAMMHGFVYASNFSGQESIPEGVPQWSIFARFTVVGYAISLLVSAYVLWLFGRYEDAPLAMMVMKAIVLGFPASLGAAAARLII